MVNLTKDPVRLNRDQVLGGLYPVQVEHGGVSKEGRGRVNDDFLIDSLLEDFPEEARPDDRVQLRELSEYGYFLDSRGSSWKDDG